MATVKFIIQSERVTAPIYIRFSIHAGKGGILKRKTREIINPDYWKTENSSSAKRENNRQKLGKAGTVKNIEQLALPEKDKIQLRVTQDKLLELEKYLYNQYQARKDNEEINGAWLEDIISAYYSGGRKLELLDNLHHFLDYFQESILPYKTNEKTGQPLSLRTQNKYKDIILHLQNFLRKEGLVLKVCDYNKHISDRFQEFLKNDMKHSAVSVGREITYPKTILKDAKRLSIQVDELVFMEVKGSKPETPCPILLIDKERGINEFQQIKDLILTDERLQLTREWMIIGIHTGQRVSDLFTLNKNMVVTKSGRKYIALAQEKTSALVEIPIHMDIINILNKYGGEFPPRLIPHNQDSNTTKFLQLIKKICKLADISRKDYGKKWDKEQNRYIYGNHPIYDLLNAHSLRRTFATMYYGILPTSVIKSVTGHGEERQLLIYINKKGDELSSKFYDLWEQEQAQEALNQNM